MKRQNSIAKAISDNNESETKKYFQKLKYKVQKVDINNKGKHPDYLVSNKDIAFLVEVKTLFDQESLTRQYRILSLLKNNFKPELEIGYSLDHSPDILGWADQDIIKALKRFERKIKSTGTKSSNIPLRSDDNLFILRYHKHSIGFFPGNAMRSLDLKRIPDRIDSAAKQLKRYNYENSFKIVMIYKNGILLESADIHQILIGSLSNMGLSGGVQKFKLNSRGACYKVNKHTSISAILFSGDISIDGRAINSGQLAIYYNPYAKKKFPLRVLNQDGNSHFEYEIEEKGNDKFVTIIRH